MAASCLATAGVNRAIYLVGDRIRSASFEEIDLIVGLLSALEELNGEIPADIYRRFTVADAPWEIGAIAQDIAQSFFTSHLKML